VGVRFGIPTLMAAATGQILSDFCGVCFGGVIESLAVKLGLPQSGMTLGQLQLPESTMLRTMCSALGVVVGCSIAMLQMFFMDLTKADRMKARKEVIPLFHCIAQETKELLDCKRVTLYVLAPSKHKDAPKANDDDLVFSLGFQLQQPTREELLYAFKIIDTNNDDLITFSELQIIFERLGYRKCVKETRGLFRTVEDALHASDRRSAGGEEALNFESFVELVPRILERMGTEISVRIKDSHLLKVATEKGISGEITNIANHEEWHKSQTGQDIPFRWRCLTGVKTRTVLIAPVIDRKTGVLLGLLEAVNKNAGQFDSSDERVVLALASHAGSVFAQQGLLDMIAQDFGR